MFDGVYVCSCSVLTCDDVSIEWSRCQSSSYVLRTYRFTCSCWLTHAHVSAVFPAEPADTRQAEQDAEAARIAALAGVKLSMLDLMCSIVIQLSRLSGNVASTAKRGSKQLGSIGMYCCPHIVSMTH